ncbi:MAG TPA: condensation domain-containing protein, partial [Pseudomonadales bacterium]|nr:condensation domain-containing protein [Pseudomonadales bacterium]
NTTFDLERGPLIQAKLIKLSAHQHILLILQHHIISDGWSIDVMLQELVRLYQLFNQGEADTLPALALQYADYAAWMDTQLNEAEASQDSAYWRKRLEDAPTLLELPAEKTRPPLQSYQGGKVKIEITEDLTATLRAFAQRHDISLYLLLLSLWSLLINRLSGQSDFLIGTPVANRDRVELEPLIGLFANTLPLRINLNAQERVIDFIQRLSVETLEAFSHQKIPFERIVEIVQPERSLNRNPLFQVMFVLHQAEHNKQLRLADLDWQSIDLPHVTSHFDLTLNLTDYGSHIGGQLEYACDLFEQETIERFARHWLTLLHSALKNANVRINDLSILSDEEQTKILLHFNQTRLAYDATALIHHLFEHQAERTPDAPALRWADTRFSYRE